ncbi:MAG: VOC family protein [Gammaproteobacteria bacterium]
MRGLLFLCVANSARSQMAAALAREHFGAGIDIASAGSRPTGVDPLAIAVMAERGIDLSAARAQSIDAIDSARFDTVVTLCAEEVCPLLAGEKRRLHWPLPDPATALPGESRDGQLARMRTLRDQIEGRIRILAALQELPPGPAGSEFHASLRVRDLPHSVRFYAWLLGIEPKEWTHRYAIFIEPRYALNFVLMVADDMPLHHDTLYHLGVAVAARDAVIEAYHKALQLGATIEKPPRTTWRGTPLHELWLSDPDGNLIEIYARLDDAELAAKPADEAPSFLGPVDLSLFGAEQ